MKLIIIIIGYLFIQLDLEQFNASCTNSSDVQIRRTQVR